MQLLNDLALALDQAHAKEVQQARYSLTCSRSPFLLTLSSALISTGDSLEPQMGWSTSRFTTLRGAITFTAFVVTAF